MNEQKRWESLLSTVIEKGHQKKQNRLVVALSTTMTLVLLVISVAVYTPLDTERQTPVRMADNEQMADMEIALMEQGIIIDDIGIIY